MDQSKVDVATIEAKLREILAIEGCDPGELDSEGCHEAEDQLYKMLLEAIADGRCQDPRACAAAALETQKMPFGRYYA